MAATNDNCASYSISACIFGPNAPAVPEGCQKATTARRTTVPGCAPYITPQCLDFALRITPRTTAIPIFSYSYWRSQSRVRRPRTRMNFGSWSDRKSMKLRARVGACERRRCTVRAGVNPAGYPCLMSRGRRTYYSVSRYFTSPLPGS